MELPNIFRGDYRKLAVIPLLLVLVSIYFIPQIEVGVDFRGGTLISLTLDQPIDGDALEMRLAGEGLSADVRVFETAVGYKAEIEFPQSEGLLRAEELKDEFEGLLPYATHLEIMAEQNSSYTAEYNEKRSEINAVADEMFVLAGSSTSGRQLEGVNELEREFGDAYREVYAEYQESVTKPIDRYVDYDSISVQTVSPMLSTHFIETAFQVAVMAAVLSAVFVFLFFRVIVPSIAIIVGAGCDIVIALGAMGLFGIPLTLPSFAALLMLVGYSLDTDILLTMRMLKRKGDPRDKAHGAMKTGLTMSVTAVIAFATLFVLATLTHIPTYYEISSVALAGLIGDMFATWGINAVMLLWYVERSEG